MIWTVLTIIPNRPTPPLPGQDVAIGVREVGCSICVLRYEKLDLCYKHRHVRLLFARTVEAPDEEVDAIQAEKIEGISDVGATTRSEESVEVSA